LRDVNISNRAHSFDFNDDIIAYQNIYSMFANVMLLIGDMHFDFCFRLEATET